MFYSTLWYCYFYLKLLICNHAKVLKEKSSFYSASSVDVLLLFVSTIFFLIWLLKQIKEKWVLPQGLSCTKTIVYFLFWRHTDASSCHFLCFWRSLHRSLLEGINNRQLDPPMRSEIPSPWAVTTEGRGLFVSSLKWRQSGNKRRYYVPDSPNITASVHK